MAEDINLVMYRAEAIDGIYNYCVPYVVHNRLCVPVLGNFGTLRALRTFCETHSLLSDIFG